MTATRPGIDGWAALRVADWAPTRQSLHMWTQVVGKVRLAAAPMINHWWQVPLYVSARGLTTSAIFGPRTFDVEFDFVDHVLLVRTTTGEIATVALEPKPVAQFYAEVMDALHRVGVDVTIRPVPVEVPEAVPFGRTTPTSRTTRTRRGRSGDSSCRRRGC